MQYYCQNDLIWIWSRLPDTISNLSEIYGKEDQVNLYLKKVLKFRIWDFPPLGKNWEGYVLDKK